ncbi:MAG: ImmA/IrrE family metallo-endopeptidase [Planctomycetaceae bacterium]
MRSALQLRRMLSVSREAPVNVYDVALALGVEVQFVDHPSLEGMFYRGPNPKILLPSWRHRPKGRIAFSCAHELGHFQLGHGTHVDEYLDDSQGRGPKSDAEFAADTFAASLLMPRQAVVERFVRRHWDVSLASPTQLFIVAGELGVGYTTLLQHMCYGLELVTDGWLKDRLKASSKEIRQAVTGVCNPPRTIVIDEEWSGSPIDLEVGDAVAHLPGLTVAGGDVIERAGGVGDYAIWLGRRAGESNLEINGRRHRVRVARTGYCGLLKYRFLDDPDEA